MSHEHDPELSEESGETPAEREHAARFSHTAASVERGAEVLRSIAATSREYGDERTAARLEQQADDAERRVARLRQIAQTSHAPLDSLLQPRVADARILVVDDHELAREAIRSVLAHESGLHLIGEASTGRDAVTQARRLRPDLVLIDVRMPDMDGLAATRAIVEAVPEARVVVLSTYDNPEYILGALRNGAAGYVLKGASKQELLATIRDVLAGAVHLQPPTSGRLLQDAAERRPSAVQPLSEREVDVLRLLARGHTNLAIGEALHLTINTVKTHVRHILDKLDAPDRAAAVARAASLGLLGPLPEDKP